MAHKKIPVLIQILIGIQISTGENIKQRYFIMNEIKLKRLFDEILSLATPAQNADNSRLSQKLKAVMPYRQNWLFYCLHGANSHTDNTLYTYFVLTKCFSLMVWLILQNKPIGEYAKRFLLVPRVRPHRPLTGLLTQNLKGVFA